MKSLPADERRVTDRDFLDALDLSCRGLAPVRRACERGDWPRARGALVDYFRTRPRPRWFFDLRRGQRGEVFCFNPAQSPSMRDADNALSNRFHLVGDMVWDFGPRLAWRTREMRGLPSAPSVFKRCNFLRSLAYAHGRTRRGVYAAKFAELMERWRADWPLVVDADFGPTSAIFSRADGHKAMPTAWRVMAWIDCLYSGIAFAPEVPVDTAFGLLKSIWFTALQYRRYAASPYAPANHHLWERGAVPFIFGTMLPEFPQVARLAAQGQEVIARHARRSFLADGGYEERSASYTLASLRMFLMPLDLASRNRLRLLDAPQRRAVARCYGLLARLTLPDGAPPDIGDGVPSAARNIPALASAALTLGSRPAATVVQRLRPTRLLDAATRRKVASLPPVDLPLTAHYPQAGYFVGRSAWTPRASAMVLSTPGPGLPNHAHDDALSLQLLVRGVPVVGTPMTEMYQILNQERYRGTVWRGHLYAMTSHNVVLVHGQPLHTPAELAGQWGPEPIPVECTWTRTHAGIRLESEHAGYPATTLSRQVDFQYRRGWTVVDTVAGNPGRPHRARWHFEYGVEVSRSGSGFVAEAGGTRLAITIQARGRRRTHLRRDRQLLGHNPLRPGTPAPWVLEVYFGGQGDDLLETSFTIA